MYWTVTNIPTVYKRSLIHFETIYYSLINTLLPKLKWTRHQDVLYIVYFTENEKSSQALVQHALLWAILYRKESFFFLLLLPDYWDGSKAQALTRTKPKLRLNCWRLFFLWSLQFRRPTMKIGALCHHLTCWSLALNAWHFYSKWAGCSDALTLK